MKKKILALALAAAMGTTMLAGCGNGGTSADNAPTGGNTQSTSSDAENSGGGSSDSATLDGTWPKEKVKIGFEVYQTTAENYIALSGYLDYLSKHFNIELVYSEDLASAEDELSFIESCASAGCVGIVGFYNVAQAEAIQHCIDLGMYYWGGEEYYDQFADNDYYVGCYTFEQEGSGKNGDYLGGYEMGYSLGEAGCKHVFYCNGGVNLGVKMFVDRQEGFIDGIKAAQADGFEIVYDETADVIEGWPGTEDFTAALSQKISNSDYDGCASSFGIEALIQPIEEAGLSSTYKVGSIGQVNEWFQAYFESGMFAVDVYDCEEVVFGNAIVDILNAYTGHLEATRGADGKAGKIYVNRWSVKDSDTYNKILAKHSAGEYYITADDVAGCLVELNPDATFDSICELYGSRDLEYVTSN